jgi:hypothetical protein
MTHIIFREPETCCRKASNGRKIVHGILEIAMTVPPDATATVYIAANTAQGVTEHRLPITRSKHVKVIGTEALRIVVRSDRGNIFLL